jgi:hypothetical protein
MDEFMIKFGEIFFSVLVISILLGWVSLMAVFIRTVLKMVKEC